MLLKKVTIHKYKNFLTEQTFEVENRITRIVGKNESGKTALLEALAKSNYFEDNDGFQFNKDLDYPRSELTKFSDDNLQVLTCEYELSDEDISNIESDFAPEIIDKKISITSHYNNTESLLISVNLNVFKNWLISYSDIVEQEKELIRAANSFSNLESIASKNIDLTGMKVIVEKLEKIKKGSAGWNNPLEGYIYETYILPIVPKFWYSNNYFNLPYRINLTEFVDKKSTQKLSNEECKIAKALFELTGLQISEIQSEDNFEAFKAQLEATSNSITDEVLKYWTSDQNLAIRFDIEHAASNVRYLNIRIYNTNYRVTLPLKSRSKGFIWFFSFFVWFSKIQDDKKINIFYY